ncbi:MAG: ABC-type transport auxiliary lipoprotein family protein [Xanthomonadales bacterium]|nr:ABC-type transport auxiliary lipoprotein family protein [Xanthomonadales bacterium]
MMANSMRPGTESVRPSARSGSAFGLVMLLIALALTGCTGVLDSNKPAREVYLLQPPVVGSTAVTNPARLVLSLITVPGLDTDDIQVLGPSARLIPVANAHWPDNLPEVISSLSRRTLVDSGLFKSVDLGDMARPGDWLLELELRAFYGVQNSAGATTSVLMQLEGTIRCEQKTEANNEVTADGFKLESSNSVTSGSLADLVAAHQSALNEILQALPVRIQQSCGTS